MIWTKDQVESANAYQAAGIFHEFTCGGKDCRKVLIATPSGWMCPQCDYTQDWAHSWMLDWSWKKHDWRNLKQRR